MFRKSLCLLPLLLGGCSLNGMVSETPSQYALTAPLPAAPTGPALPVQLVVDEPSAPLSLNTVRIPVETDAGALDYYAGVGWTDRLPALVQSRLREGFEQSGRLAAVVGPDATVIADIALATDLREFVARPSGVTIRASARLINLSGRDVLSSRSFELTRPAGGNFAAVRAAYDAAIADLVGQMVAWTLTQLPQTTERAR